VYQVGINKGIIANPKFKVNVQYLRLQ